MMQRFIQALGSLKVTVVCLFLLFLLTFGGTVYQVEYGLYLAQKKFFHSLFFTLNGIPLPGAQSVLWVLFANLLLGFLYHLKFHRKKVGILVIHIGILAFFVSSFVTHHLCQEAHLSLQEGQGRNTAESYQDWELSIWEEHEGKRNVIGLDAKHFSIDEAISVPEFGLTITPESYYKNAQIKDRMLTALPTEPEPEKNAPGGTFTIAPGNETLVLHGWYREPITLKVEDRTFYLQLRHKRLVLPFMVELVDFRKEEHPGTAIARSYESTVKLHTGNNTREALIFMNEPLRHKDFTFYQASYGYDNQGNEFSTLAVVKNAGRLLPYISTFILVLGLLIHVAQMASRLKPSRQEEAS